MSKIYGGTTTTPINPKVFGGSGTLLANIVNNVFVIEGANSIYSTKVKDNVLMLSYFQAEIENNILTI